VAHRLVFSKLHEKLGGNLRFAVSGGAALPEEIGTFFQAAGVTIIEGYGLTETAPVLTVNPVDAPRYGTVGHILPAVTVAIQPLDNDEPVGTVSGSDYPTSLSTPEGEVLVKGPNVMKAYWNQPEQTRAAFDADGWYHSGDVGRFEEGYLKITDRIKHMIVTEGGKNVYPGPIEETFKTKGWIDQIVVIGEGRPFLAALVVPDFKSLRIRVREEDVDVASYSDAELLDLDEARALFQDVFDAYNREAAAHEKIRTFRLLSEPFTVEEGTLTPTLKLRRSVIEERHADQIDAVYEEFGL
jgi:long-chain acyl-CoA synthetase